MQRQNFEVKTSQFQAHMVSVELELVSRGFTEYYTKIRQALAETKSLQNGSFSAFFKAESLANYVGILEKILASEIPVKSGVIREYANKNGVNWVILARIYFGEDSCVNQLYLKYLDLNTVVDPRTGIENEIPRALTIILRGIEGVEGLLSLGNAPLDIPKMHPQVLD